MSNRCVERVHRRGSGSGFGSYERCTRIGIAQHNGCWYCGIHNPERIKARRAKKEAERSREFDLRMVRGLILDTFRDLGESIYGNTPSDLSNAQRGLINRIITLRERLAKLEGANECKAN